MRAEREPGGGLDLQALESRASDGPWRVRRLNGADMGSGESLSGWFAIDAHGTPVAYFGGPFVGTDDAAAIVAARNALPFLTEVAAAAWQKMTDESIPDYDWDRVDAALAALDAFRRGER